MKESADRVARFVDELLHGRRPHRFEATQDEAEAMTAGATLSAARVGADVPDRSEAIRNPEAAGALQPCCLTTEPGGL